MPQKRGLGSGIDVLIPKAQGTKKGEEKKKYTHFICLPIFFYIL